MLSIRKQREAASDRAAAPDWARTDSLSTVGATFAPGAGAGRETAVIEGTPVNSWLAAQELSGAFNSRQLLV